MNIQNFRTSINTKGVLRNNRFIARIVFPTNHYLYNIYTQSQELFSIRCESLNLPGLSMASADGPPRLGYGPIEKRPYNTNFEDITLTFILDANSQIHKMFYDWTNSIINFRSEGLLKLSGNANATAAYEVGYKDNYSVDLHIDVYKDSGPENSTESDKPVMTATLYKAFPIGMPGTPLGWEQSDIFKLSIPFAYTDYTVKYNV